MKKPAYWAFSCLLFFNTNGKVFGQGKISLALGAKMLKYNDSVCFKFFKYGIDCNDNFILSKGVNAADSIIRCQPMNIDASGVVTVSYYRNGKYVGGLPGSYCIEPGDSVTIIDNGTDSSIYKQYFTGRGNGKFNVQLYLMVQEAIFSNKYPDYTNLDHKRINALDSFSQRQLRYIENAKNGVSELARLFLRSHVLLFCETAKYQALNLKDSKSKVSFENTLFQKYIQEYAQQNIGNVGELYFYLKQRSNYYASGNNDRKYENLYFSLKNFSTGMVRQQLLLEFFFREKSSSLSKCVKDALPLFDNSPFAVLLKDIEHDIGIGKNAYNFRLKDTLDCMHSLSDFKGKVVVLDFWFTGCINCLKLKPLLQKIENNFYNEPVQFITISIDQDKRLWMESLRKHIYTSLHTLDLIVCRTKNDIPEVKRFNLKSYPTLIVIDKNGKIADTPIDPRLDNGKNLVDIIHNLL